MKVFSSLVCLLSMLAATSTGAAERRQVNVEKVLRESGLSRRADLTLDAKFAIKVGGTEQKPEFVNASCHSGQSRDLSIKGKRFSYAADNRGEWGGALNVRENGGLPRPIVPGNVQALFPIKDDLYVFTGLSHIGADYGALHVIEKFDSQPAQRLLT